MPSISKQSIETLKAQLNLVDVVSPYVQLKKAGRSWTGLSPFTQEKTPSFYVHPEKGFFKCFSTGEGGDCYSFIMKLENLQFFEAVEFLSQKFNIAIQYEKGHQSAKELSIRKQVLEIHSTACEWFHAAFRKSQEADKVRDYWQHKRKFTLKIAEEHKIGYAPTQANALAMMLEKRGFSIEAIKSSGLFFSNESEKQIKRLKSRFRGRLMIPIRDLNGRVVAFTARQLEQTPLDDPSHKAKYVNSPETLIFHKSKLLFGMDHARKHLDKLPYFILVEGQLDALRCWSIGLHTAIAPQGTAITEDQLQLLRRYQVSRIECLLDGDTAGQKAALRTLPLAFRAGLEFTYLTLPEKTDPDDLFREEGISSLEVLRTKAFGPIELFLKTFLPKFEKSSTQEKIKASEKLFELLNEIKSEIAQEDYLKKMSKIAQISINSLNKDFINFKRLKAQRNSYSKPQISDEPKETKEITQSPLTQTNWELLYLIINFPEYGNQIAHLIDSNSIDNKSITGNYLKKMLLHFHEETSKAELNLETLIEDTNERTLLADIHSKELEIDDPKKSINDCLRILKKYSLNKKKAILTEKIQKTKENDIKLIELMKEMKQINRDLVDTKNLAIQ